MREVKMKEGTRFRSAGRAGQGVLTRSTKKYQADCNHYIAKGNWMFLQQNGLVLCPACAKARGKM